MKKSFWHILFPSFLSFDILPLWKQFPWLVQEIDSEDKIKYQQEAESLSALWPSGARRTLRAPHLPRIQVFPEDISEYSGPRHTVLDGLEKKWRNSSTCLPLTLETPLSDQQLLRVQKNSWTLSLVPLYLFPLPAPTPTSDHSPFTQVTVHRPTCVQNTPFTSDNH